MMSTLIGLKCERGLEGVVLFSDFSKTQTQWMHEPSEAIKQQTRSASPKFYADDKREIVVGASGITDESCTFLFSQILKDNSMARRAIDKGFFQELADLNSGRRGGYFSEPAKETSLLLSTRFDAPRLFHCYPEGRVEEKFVDALGTGAGFAIEYLLGQGRIIPSALTIEQGIDYGFKALQRASKDIFTRGLDLYVVTSAVISEYGNKIRSAAASARRKAIEEVKREYRINRESARFGDNSLISYVVL
jgi:hypothetical protein